VLSALLPSESASFDLAVDMMLEAESGDREHHLRVERRVLLELALAERLAHGLLDLALRGDPHHLQEFTDFHVEGVFVHRVVSSVLVVAPGPLASPGGTAIV